MRTTGFGTKFTMFLFVFATVTLLSEGTSLTANVTADGEIFVVTNANDAGPGSFRQAITDANANVTPSPDKIVFNIPGAGIKVISLLTPLPEITDPLVIDGSTQPGYAGAPLIELDGANVGVASGLVITAAHTYVGGLAIGRFQGAGVVLRSDDGSTIQANYIGVDATGTLARPNNLGIQVSNSRNNLIGGSLAGNRNVISGNLSHGVELAGNNNLVQGNFIGTNSAGTAAIGNGSSGVEISGTNNLIGGNSPGTSNLISGNNIGINIASSGTTIQGNLIGTDVSGTSRVSNMIGVQAEIRMSAFEIPNTVIGGLTPGARNVISGNLLNIVLDVVVHGPGVIIQGNYIGTDVTGTRALGRDIGILVLSDHHSIAQNVISGNSIGIVFGQPFVSFKQGNNNIIQGNLIGLNAQGTGPLPNDQEGITLQAGSSNNTITANKIAFNGASGVAMFGGTRNSIRGNSIFSNGKLGIDLGFNGVTPNDPADADFGENNLQNFPVITSVLSIGSSTTVQGSLNSTPNTTFQIEFFSNAALDASGYGEGALFFGTTPVTTDSNGDATINVTFPVALGTGRVVTATATDPDGNTSEFSAGDSTGVAGNVQFSVGSIRVIEDVGLVTVTVLRQGGSSGNLTIDYATVDGTAKAGHDYTAASGTLTFSGGETSKSFQIPITDDAVTEPDETFTVTLSNPPSLEALGTPNTLVVTIQDRTTVPAILQNNASVVEGNSGSITDMLFTFSLSAASGRSVSVDYATSDLGATGGAFCSNKGTDYITTSGKISFQPGATSVTIPVKVCGDTSAEANENFFVNLSNPINATLDVSQAQGTIIDDDVLQLLLEQSGPTINQAATLDAVLFLRDPFSVVTPEWFSIGPDRNTRVMFFVRGLQLNPGELPSAVTVMLSSVNNELFEVPAEDVRPVPNVDFAQLVIRFPDNLPASVYTVIVRAHFKTSNSGRIRIAP
jgi:parallel beta-helix repeat protein